MFRALKPAHLVCHFVRHHGTSSPAASKSMLSRLWEHKNTHLVRHFVRHHGCDVAQVQQRAAGASQQGGLSIRDHACMQKRAFGGDWSGGKQSELLVLASRAVSRCVITPARGNRQWAVMARVASGELMAAPQWACAARWGPSGPAIRQKPKFTPKATAHPSFPWRRPKKQDPQKQAAQLQHSSPQFSMAPAATSGEATASSQQPKTLINTRHYPYVMHSDMNGRQAHPSSPWRPPKSRGWPPGPAFPGDRAPPAPPRRQAGWRPPRRRHTAGSSPCMHRDAWMLLEMQHLHPGTLTKTLHAVDVRHDRGLRWLCVKVQGLSIRGWRACRACPTR